MEQRIKGESETIIKSKINCKIYECYENHFRTLLIKRYEQEQISLFEDEL